MVLQKLNIHMQENEISSFFSPVTNSGQKCLIKIRVKFQSIKLLKENIGETLHDIGIGMDSVDNIPKTKGTSGIISNFKSLYIVKEEYSK